MPSNTILIEGSFEELCTELVQYIDQTNKSSGQESNLEAEVEPLLKEEKKEEALKKVVTASPALNNAPEREFIAAYNLLIHLVRQAPNPDIFLPRLCQNLSQPITSSPSNGTGLALNVLATVFNTLSPDQESRYHVLLAILKTIRSQNTFEQLEPQLKNLETWLSSWQMEKDEQRKLYLAISDVATNAGEEKHSYEYLLKALRTTQDGSDASSEEAKSLTIRALTTALNDPHCYDFQDLTALDSTQALRKSDSTWFDLLEIFSSETLDDYADFQESHSDFVSSHNLSPEVLERKMRLLTLASLAASAGSSRQLPYAQISKALRVPAEDVEMWVIDVIRAGLVEGKLSQSSQTFLIHRSTYRVFGENQWREVASRLDMWRGSLTGVLRVIREQKEQFIRDKEQELRDAEQSTRGSGYRPSRQMRNAVEVE